MKMVVLYEELAPYFLKCLEVFANKYKVEVTLFCKEINNTAPFVFDSEDSVQIIYRNTLSDKELFDRVVEIRPDVLYCGGWASKVFIKLARFFKDKTITVVGFDSKWFGTIKQKLLKKYYLFTVTRNFDFCFVPGIPQKEFALEIGFQEKRILLGAYSCDFDWFNSLYESHKLSKSQNCPKRFLFVGRYAEEKGIEDLWNSFIEMQIENPNDWELWCLGKGKIEPVIHSKIKHFGFVQPKDISYFIENTSVFVLPSRFEPWGVVIHEFAAAGFPIICSKNVGASTQFVKSQNGIIYSHTEPNSLKMALLHFVNKNEDELIKMSKFSNKLGATITPNIWSRSLFNVFDKINGK
jgi:glycosyltransferase involved in cell wall biosynthesis